MWADSGERPRNIVHSPDLSLIHHEDYSSSSISSSRGGGGVARSESAACSMSPCSSQHTASATLPDALDPPPVSGEICVCVCVGVCVCVCERGCTDGVILFMSKFLNNHSCPGHRMPEGRRRRVCFKMATRTGAAAPC